MSLGETRAEGILESASFHMGVGAGCVRPQTVLRTMGFAV